MEPELSDQEYLIECSRQGEYDEVANCIKAKVPLDSVDEHKNTALRISPHTDMASANQFPKIVELLLQNGANSNVANESGSTPMRITIIRLGSIQRHYGHRQIIIGI
jgi:ankyrin repeat protein